MLRGPSSLTVSCLQNQIPQPAMGWLLISDATYGFRSPCFQANKAEPPEGKNQTAYYSPPSIPPATWDCTVLTAAECTPTRAHTHMHMCTDTHTSNFFKKKNHKPLLHMVDEQGEEKRERNSTLFRKENGNEGKYEEMGETVQEQTKGADSILFFSFKSQK